MPDEARFCPQCGAALGAPRQRGEGQWNCGWRNGLPEHRQRIAYGTREADVVSPCGTVVELQWGPLDRLHIQERELVYGAMVWLFFAVDAHIKGRLRLQLEPGKELVFFNWRSPRETIDACRRPIYLDLGQSDQVEGQHLVLKLGRTYPQRGWLRGNGWLYTAESFHNWMAHSIPLTPWLPAQPREEHTAA